MFTKNGHPHINDIDWIWIYRHILYQCESNGVFNHTKYCLNDPQLLGHPRQWDQGLTTVKNPFGSRYGFPWLLLLSLVPAACSRTAKLFFSSVASYTAFPQQKCCSKLTGYPGVCHKEWNKNDINFPNLSLQPFPRAKQLRETKRDGQFIGTNLSTLLLQQIEWHVFIPRKLKVNEISALKLDSRCMQCTYLESHVFFILCWLPADHPIFTGSALWLNRNDANACR